MATVRHRLFINAPLKEIYHGVSTPEGLDAWWTLQCVGRPELKSHYRLYFGPGYDWKAEVTKCTSDSFALKIFNEDPDWNGTIVTFTMKETEAGTALDFSHEGWETENEHFRHSAFCWALYLRLLKRYVESGEVVPYANRND